VYLLYAENESCNISSRQNPRQVMGGGGGGLARKIVEDADDS
jgi:hypothetical protein